MILSTKLDLALCKYFSDNQFLAIVEKILLRGGLNEVPYKSIFREKGMFLITFKAGNRDCGRLGWVYHWMCSI